MDIQTARAYGTVQYRPSAPRGSWVVTAAPHVTVRLKRLLPRVQASRTGALVITDTPEIARDLEWLLERWPMEMDSATREHLADQADAHRDSESAVLSILNGARINTGVRTPAREPYPEQLQAADIVLATGRLLVTDDVGLGKSNTSLLVLRAADALPALIVTMTHLPQQWIGQELAKTWPDLLGHVVTSRTVYDPTSKCGGRDPDVLAISYSKLDGWADYLAGVVKTVIFDEIQELRHAGTNKYVAAAQLADSATYRVGLSATPVFNYGGEMHNIISVLSPDALGSREEFLREWGQDIGDGKVKVKDPRALGEYLRDQGLMMGRTREDVGRPLPKPIIVAQNVDADTAVLDKLSGDAVEMAKFILDRSNNRTDRWTASGELDMRMRQATGIAKAPFVAEFVRMLLSGGTDRLVLWGWHRAVYDIWTERLADFQPVLYTGTESPARKRAAAEEFMSGRSRVLIMSLRSGAGLDGLQYHCDTGVFGELDWSPQVPVQCIGRLARDGITKPPTAYFCVSDHGADPAMAEVLDIKRMQADPMINPKVAAVQPIPDNTDRIRALAESLVRAADTQRARTAGMEPHAVAQIRPEIPGQVSMFDLINGGAA